jgi:hypothetical protein
MTNTEIESNKDNKLDNDTDYINHKSNINVILSPIAIISRARLEIENLTGYKADSVASFEKNDNGWHLVVTTVELHRIPASTDVLANYDVIIDAQGSVVNYKRISRYTRGQPSDRE